jgi:hypothetical protein
MTSLAEISKVPPLAASVTSAAAQDVTGLGVLALLDGHRRAGMATSSPASSNSRRKAASR